MRKIFNALILFLLLAWPIHAQKAPIAYLGFMNAVGLPSKTDVRIDGHSLKPAGFPEGNYIESFGLPVGSHQFVFANSDCAPVNLSIEVSAAPAPLYVLFNAPIPQSNGKIRQLLKVVMIPGQPPAHSQRRFVAFYASDRPSTTVTINGAAINVASGKPMNLSATSLDVVAGSGGPMHYAPSTPGNYVVIFFDGSDAHLHQAMLQME